MSGPFALRCVRALAAAVALTLPSAGCALLRPPPPELSPERVVRGVEDNAGTFRTLKDTDIALTFWLPAPRGRRRSPTLGGHVVYDRALPGLWLSAEKFGRQLFDLKALGSRFWLAVPEHREVLTGGPLAYARVPLLLRPGEMDRLLSGPEGLGMTWPTCQMTVEKKNYLFRVTVMGAPYVEVLVDRRKLVVREIRRFDAAGRPITRMRLDGYRPVNGRLFPRRLRVGRPRWGTAAQLKLGDPELDVSLPEAAFHPPDRPGWEVIDLDRQPLSNSDAFGGSR